MLLDSNVFIYASRTEAPEHPDVRDFLRLHENQRLFASEITRVEVLGYTALTPAHLLILNRLFSSTIEFRITPAIDLAIGLRQRRRGLRTPDALIAATALLNEMPLVTYNVRDFEWVDGLTILDLLT